jgi:alpha-mannosidase
MHRATDPFARLAWVFREHLLPSVWSDTVALEVGAFHVHGEPVSASVALAADYVPFGPGEKWGPPWGTSWFRVRGAVPAEWAGSTVVAKVSSGLTPRIGFGGEALVFSADGQPQQGLSWDHDEWPVAAPAAGGEPVELYIEAAANPNTLPHFRNGRDAVPLFDAEPDGDPIMRFGRADLVVKHDDVADLCVDFELVQDLARQLGVRDRRGAQLVAALDECCRRLDLDDVVGSAAAARVPLVEALSVRASSAAHRVTAVGHAHIDTAWLWPLRETRRKVARTFATALKLMDEYPEYVFLASQPQQYAWLADEHPGLFARVRERVAEGRWEAIGAMWIEADTNLTSGESLVRQIVHGKRWFRDQLGVDSTEVWLPDVFGYCAQLPQIMRRAGIDRFLTQKMSWNDTNKPPHSTFRWAALDGSAVLAHFPPAETYNGVMTVEELRRSERTFRDHGLSERSLYPFGWGDGGGGPSRPMLERARRLADTEGLPRVVVETARSFFAALEADDAPLPVWSGELYLERHRGTYTTHADIKAGNRWGEQALHDAELWSSFAPDVDVSGLDAAWKLLLLHQFHDILPGSSIHWVYEDAARDHATVLDVAHHIRDQSLDLIAASIPAPSGSLVLFNALPHERSGVLLLAPDAFPADTTSVAAEPVQRLHDGRWAVRADVPAHGWVTVMPSPGQSDKPAAEVARVDVTSVAGSAASTVSDRHLENELLRVEWGDDGQISSILHKGLEREVVAEGRAANVFQLFPDRPENFDAWDIDRQAFDHVEELSGPTSIEVVDEGPLLVAVRFRWTFGDSSIDQVVSLASGSPVLEFATDVDWHEDHELLKVAFPVDVRAPRATYEVQYGHVERATHDNTSWDDAQYEVCAHRWADLSETGLGVALLNDCKYGYDIKGNVLRLSLLRAPAMPDPIADRGAHHFTYALLPHAGDFRSADVPAHAATLAVPVDTRPTPSSADGGDGSAATSLVESTSPGVVISAVKRADSGEGLVVRMFEAWGGRRRTQLRLAAPFQRAQRADLLEQPLPDTDSELSLADGTTLDLELGAFEIATVLLT